MSIVQQRPSILVMHFQYQLTDTVIHHSSSASNISVTIISNNYQLSSTQRVPFAFLNIIHLNGSTISKTTIVNDSIQSAGDKLIWILGSTTSGLQFWIRIQMTWRLSSSLCPLPSRCPSEPQYDIVKHRRACPSKHYK